MWVRYWFYGKFHFETDNQRSNRIKIWFNTFFLKKTKNPKNLFWHINRLIHYESLKRQTFISSTLEFKTLPSRHRASEIIRKCFLFFFIYYFSPMSGSNRPQENFERPKPVLTDYTDYEPEDCNFLYPNSVRTVHTYVSELKNLKEEKRVIKKKSKLWLDLQISIKKFAESANKTNRLAELCGNSQFSAVIPNVVQHINRSILNLFPDPGNVWKQKAAKRTSIPCYRQYKFVIDLKFE